MALLTQRSRAGSYSGNYFMTDDRYKLRIVTRCAVAGLRLRPGSTLLVPADKLRVAAHLARCGSARPGDERTRIDIQLFEALRSLR